MIARLPHPWKPGPFPYDLLDADGFSPLSSHGELLDGSLRMMAEGKVTRAVREAFDQLQALPQRLAVDFFIYRPSAGRLEDA